MGAFPSVGTVIEGRDKAVVSTACSWLATVALAIVLVMLPSRADAQFNCWGSVYNNDASNPLRTCSNPEFRYGPWEISGPGNPWVWNHCVQGWNIANCRMRGGTPTPGNECYACTGGGEATTESNVADQAHRLVQLWVPDCTYVTSDSGWGYSGTVTSGGYTHTLGPDEYSPQGELVNTVRLFTHTLVSGPATCSSVLYHMARKSRAQTVACPFGTSGVCYLCGNYCVRSSPGSCPSNNPVEIGFGAKVHTDVDFVGAGAGLQLRRTYNSHGFHDPLGGFAVGFRSSPSVQRGGIFGLRWRTNYDRRLYPVNSTASSQWWTLPTTAMASAQREDGTVQHFGLNGLEAMPRPGNAPARLTKLATTCPTDPALACYEYRSPNDEVERYNTAGLLIEIARHSSGNESVTLTYDANERLLQVTDQTGRKISFTYAGFRVQAVTLPDGSSITYTYDVANNLSTVSYPPVGSQSAPVREYHYESTLPGGQQLLTGVTDENGFRTLEVTYDANGRVASTVRAPSEAGGTINRYTYAYSTATPSLPTTTYTTPLNATVVRTHEYWRDSLRLRTQSQPCPACGGSNSSARTHDANGYLDTETDFRGVVTDYAVDSIGRTTQKVEVANAACPAALPNCQSARRTTTTSWHATFNQPVERTLTNSSGAPEEVLRTELDVDGRATARCKVDPNNSGALAYTCGSAVHAPLGVRQTRTTYCTAVNLAAPDAIGSPTENLGKGCPSIGLVRRIDGSRTDVNDQTTYEYRLADDASCATSPSTCPFRKGDLWKITNALGHVTEYVSYDGAGRVTRIKDANGTFTDLTYHPRGWLASRTIRANSNGTPNSGSDATTTISYDAVGQVIKVTQPDGDFLRYWYDGAHRLVSISDSDTPGAGNRMVYTLDAAGNRIKEETLEGTTTLRRRLARQYDVLGRLRSIVQSPYAAQPNLDDPVVKKAAFTYDANGNQETSTDQVGTVTDNDFDPLGRLVKTIADLGVGVADINAQTGYTYDARDNLRTVVDPKNLTTSYLYDGLGNLVELQSPDTGVTTYGYDSAGNRLSQTDARGVTASYTHDALDRMTSINYPDASLNVTFGYDQANSVTGCASSQRLGRLTRIVDASGSTSLCYDRRGNVIRKIQVTAGITLTTDFTYTRADRIATITYPGGARARYGRDAQGRLNRLWWRPAGTTTETQVVKAAAWLPYGPMRSMTFGNNRTLVKTYDQNYWIDSVVGAPGGLSLDLSTNDLGNIVGLGTGTAANDRVYGYDDLSRLTSALTGTSANVEAYAYDATGNRLSKQVGGSAVVPYAYPGTSHRLHAVGGVVRSYDAAGNTTQMPSATAAPLTLVYDARNRLARVDGGAGTLYANHYNGRGERVRKVAGAVDTRYVYDERGQLLGEYDSAGIPRQLFVWMDEMPVLVVEGATLRYIETDHLNTPRALIDPARNLPVWRWDLHGSAFGENAANEDPDGDGTAVRFNLRFPGQYLDGEVGLHYNYFRDYEPSTGRYVQSDPIGLDGGFATYAYVQSDPFGTVDPDGLNPVPMIVRVCTRFPAVCAALVACRTNPLKCRDLYCKANSEIGRYKILCTGTPTCRGDEIPWVRDLKTIGWCACWANRVFEKQVCRRGRSDTEHDKRIDEAREHCRKCIDECVKGDTPWWGPER